MSDLKEHVIRAGKDGEQIELSLWQKPNRGKIPVLLLHGASANHETFLNPSGADPESGDPRCLTNWLFVRGFEPWLLNWRGNGRIKDDDLITRRKQLDFDMTAEHDIPAALKRIKKETGRECSGAVGHCMGAATLAQAIAAGHVGRQEGLTHVCLLAIGLFYEPAVDGRLKGQDYALERLWADRANVSVDPRNGDKWPEELREIYDNWPLSLRPHPQPQSTMDDICNRVSFMYGPPYRERNLHPEVHQGTFLAEQFGAIPLRMYVHGAQNIRRGWAAKFDAKNDADLLLRREAQDNFAALDQVTLITGAKNEIWHRDSIDRMDEWLNSTRAGRRNSRKEILPDYAHQDLLWGTDAVRDVFPIILNGLPPRS